MKPTTVLFNPSIGYINVIYVGEPEKKSENERKQYRCFLVFCFVWLFVFLVF